MAEEDGASCPACGLEARTGETAPRLAHGWRSPSAAEMERIEIWVGRDHPDWLDDDD